MTWQLFTTVGLNQRLRLELLHVQYPSYCMGYESRSPVSLLQGNDSQKRITEAKIKAEKNYSYEEVKKDSSALSKEEVNKWMFCIGEVFNFYLYSSYIYAVIYLFIYF